MAFLSFSETGSIFPKSDGIFCTVQEKCCAGMLQTIIFPSVSSVIVCSDRYSGIFSSRLSVPLTVKGKDYLR